MIKKQQEPKQQDNQQKARSKKQWQESLRKDSKAKTPVQNNPEPKNKDLEGQIDDLKKVIADLNDKLLRSLAESDNLRRRSASDLEKANKYAVSNFASDLVTVMENFYLSVENMPVEEIEKSQSIKNFADGIVMTKRELTKVFEKNGIKRLSPLGDKFDHNYHEAIAKINSDKEEGVIVKVVQSGYLINDRLIRPALVGVSTGVSE